MTRTAFALTAVCFLLIGPTSLHHAAFTMAHAQDDWKSEFDDICAKTDDPMALSAAELKNLIERCDALKPRLRKLGESESKVYLKRLQMCRDFFVFVLDSPAKR